jgi:hypothetical protein
VLRIRNKSIGSGFGSGSGLKLVSDPDSNPVPNPDSNPGSNLDPNLEFGTGKKLFFVLKFYPASSSNIKRLPSLSYVTWLRKRCAINLQDSDPDLFVRGTDPLIRIRISTKKSWIHNTAYN